MQFSFEESVAGHFPLKMKAKFWVGGMFEGITRESRSAEKD